MFIRTERLFLRPAWEEDAPALTCAIAHAPVARRLARVPWPYEVQDAAAWIGAPRGLLCPALLVTLPAEEGRIIGGCGLHQDAAGEPVEIGIWITPARQRQRYGHEALAGLLDIARAAGHRHVTARHFADDAASAALIAGAGFRPLAGGPGAELAHVLDLGGGDSLLPGPWLTPIPYTAGINAAA